ncbi:MAG: UTP--glucose-1-phosphate uridylyltransferase [Candidatus Moranbacteria bacterium RIFOXYA12_FULL_35_19]|nr:MAG: UTP-glucose-1-phosphate uridylyltransferase [Candidatus Moranbacteria bacterium GW2011_GWF2_35_39]OGI30908.1 MAG: UTP--glucose-1-phosphate uridylyltransferase [Candidatus Moranbacteria bacterium RIFOXYB12_FULL_35_8]OGI32327.1 MAG: UTP--glucose-1-phosphate uridylyltransferase [Candidatus Moranbacteria bacterium RIFOXYC12_FULL_36_13]OGI36587.1 MAG: UTP--glucose-1-phosphate uridylyltransferase [Candidatus Moranbacteria bacterium RIFOXYA12_FULL_35_19]
MSKIKKAIIAVAGSGTRLLPATKSMPKEMLPIVDKPIIQLIVEELVEAGIEDIIFVTRWDKKPLEDHFDHTWALENDLEKNGKTELAQEIKKIAEMANFIYVRQKGPYGNGTPVLSAASLVDDEPFVFVWGDDLVKSKVSFTKQMVDDYNQNGNLMIGVQEVPRETVNRYGIVKLKEGTMEIEDIIEKPTIEEAPSNLADFGRMILDQNIITVLKDTALGKGNELWIVDAIRTYVKNGGKFMAKKVEGGEWMTTGDPLNYMKAILAYAYEREDLKNDLGEYIKTLKL